MAGNLYDETLEQTASAPPQGNPYDSVLEQQDAGQAHRLKTSIAGVTDVAPDTAAKAATIGQKLGIPAEVVQRNLPDMEKRARLVDTPYRAMLEETPALASWVAEPAHAAVAHDDLEKLGALEWLVTAWPRQIAQTVNQMKYGELRSASMFRALTQDEQDQMAAYKLHSEMGGKLGAGESWFKGAITGTAAMFAQQFPTTEYGAAAYGAGAVIGGAVAAVAGLPIAAAALGTAAIGGRAGVLYGVVKSTYQQESAQAYDEYLGFKDEHGQPIDPLVAKAAAIVTGAINAPIEAWGLEKVIETIPGIRTLSAKSIRGAVRTALLQPTIRAALRDAVVGYGKALTSEVVQEVAQQGVTILSGELAKASQDKPIHRTPEQVAGELADTFTGAVQSFALGLLPGPAMSFLGDARRAQTAQHGVTFYKALGEGVAQSKTVERLPQAAQDFLEHATKDGPVPTLYAPVESWTKYWQSQDVDPAAIAADVTGNPDAYDEAIRTGGDLAIPTARYAVKLAATEHNGYFSNELRLGPDEMNGREAQKFEEDLKAAQAAQAEAAKPEAPAVSPVRAAVLEQLAGAGVPTSTAESYAQLYESAFGTLAERAGLDPAQLYESYGLEVQRPDLAGVEGAGTAAPAGEASRQEAPPVPSDAGGRPLFTSPEGNVGPPGGTSDVETAAAELSGRAAAGGQDQAIPVMADIVGAAAAMRRENPNIDRQAQAMRDRATAAGRIPEPKGRGVVDRNADAAQNPENYFNAEAGNAPAAQEGPGSSDAQGQQPGADVVGAVQGGGDGGGAEPRRAPAGIPQLDEVFRKPTAEDTAARLTPNVQRELHRILDELQRDTYEGASWHWLDDETGTTGNAAGGHANKRPGHGGAPVYHDVLAHAPMNLVSSGKNKGQAAERAHGDRSKVEQAIARLLDTGTVTSNLQEGAIRVAENRDAGIYRDLSRPTLPPSWGTPVERGFTDALSEAIDQADQPGDMLTDQGFEQDAVDVGQDGDTTFDIKDFSQSLFDDLASPDPKIDILADTGEQQPRLPGDTGAVRDQNVQTPAFDAPFSLTSEIAKPTKGGQTTLFQPGYHGSPHKFEAFSLHAIGTGEGAQAYGWGLYFASQREVADRYRESLAGKPTDKQLSFKSPDDSNVADGPIFGKDGLYNSAISPEMRLGLGELHARAHFMPAGPKGMAELRDQLERTVANYERVKDTTETMSGDKEVDRYRFEEAKAALAALNHFGDQLEIRPPSKPGRTYTVDLPEDDDFLAWDKPASQQSEKVQSALKALGITWEPLKLKTPKQALQWFNGPTAGKLAREDIGIRGSLREGRHYAETDNVAALNHWQVEHQGLLNSGVIDPTGHQVYEELTYRKPEKPVVEQYRVGARVNDSIDLASKAERASKMLAAQGVAGIRYLDGMSRSAGEGSSNYVVFDPALAPITEYDQPLIELTPAHVEAWAKELRERVGPDLAVFDLRLTQAGDIQLDTLAVSRGAQRAGLGSKVMLELTRFADLNGRRIILAVATKGYQPVEGGVRTSSAARLVTFYKRFGFVENKGRFRDFSMKGGMYREPTLPGREFSQDPGARRGAIRFGPDRQFTIALLERADLSTFLHESGHFFLEVFGDVADRLQALPLEQLTETQRHVLSDYGHILKALGVESRADVQETQHEEFARLFEAYLMEGKAPGLELSTAFARFRAWLVGIYQSLKSLNVNLTPEVRAVMDRLLASDQAIAEAEALRNVPAMFTTADSAGMTVTEFGLYQRTIADASKTAREQLDRKLLSEVQREQTAAWKERQAEIRGQVEDDVHQRPAYRALAAILKGEHPNGDPLVEGLETAPLGLSRAIVNDTYGSDRAKRLPRGVFAAEGGLHPDVVARLFGYSSGDEMLHAIEDAPPMRDVIRQETAQRMIAEHGSILLDGTIHQAAQAATANDDREAVIRAELRALGRLRRTVSPFVKQAKAEGVAALAEAERERAYERRWFEAEAKLRIAIAEGRKQVVIDALRADVSALKAKARGGAVVIRAAVPPAGLVRDAAKARIAAMTIRQINPQTFWSASRRAGQQALERAARQDFDGAIQAKTQELTNLAMYREAERVIEDIQTRVRYAQDLGKPATRKRIGLAGEAYLDQVDGILDRYEFARASAKVLERRAGIREFVAGLEAQGIPVELPAEVLDDSRRINYRELTVDALVGVTDGLKQLMHLVSLKNKLLKIAAAREFAAMRDAIVDSIEANGEARPKVLEIGPKERRARIVGEWFASHTKLATMAQALDGYQDGGQLWEAFVRPTNEAAAAQASMHEAAAGTMLENLTTAYPGRELGRLSDTLFIPAINGSLSREARIAVALNWGNEGNRQRLMENAARGWTAEQVQAILDTLDARDLKFVQASIDHVNSYREQIAAKQRRVTGIEPEWVDAAPWHHAQFGEQPGGYYPIAYDGRLLMSQGNIIDASQANLQQFAGYSQATTKRGYLETRRQKVNAPIRLELSVMYEHVENVIHDLTHHEMLIDVGRLMNDRKVQAAIASRGGDIVYKQIRGAFMDIALGTRHATQSADRAINYVRSGTTIAGLGWNFWTSLQQPLGVFNGMARIGPTWVAKGIGRVFRDAGSLEWSARWVNEKSPMMRQRDQTLSREVADLRSTLKRAGGWFDVALRTVSGDHITQEDVTGSFLFMIEKSQQMADLPVWIGGYEKAMAGGETEARAIALADQGVLDSQSGGQIKDLAQVQRGGPMFKLFTTFYSYGNLVFNQTAREIGRTDFRRVGSVGQMLGNLSLIYVVPAALTVALAKATGHGGGDDDGWLAPIGKELLATAFNTMILLRELSGAAQMVYSKSTGAKTSARGYEGPAGLRIISSIGNLATQASQGVADHAFVRAAEDVAGVLFHLPLAQVQRSIDGFVALEEGQTSNPAALLVGPSKKAAR